MQRQREFAANASHELRTPLTVIGASVEDLRRNRLSKVEDVGEALGDIEAEVKHMTALVEDMLLLARTDSGVVEIERVPVDLGDIAADAASSSTSSPRWSTPDCLRTRLRSNSSTLPFRRPPTPADLTIR